MEGIDPGDTVVAVDIAIRNSEAKCGDCQKQENRRNEYQPQQFGSWLGLVHCSASSMYFLSFG
jgi:hypothetical protein